MSDGHQVTFFFFFFVLVRVAASRVMEKCRNRRTQELSGSYGALIVRRLGDMLLLWAINSMIRSLVGFGGKINKNKVVGNQLVEVQGLLLVVQYLRTPDQRLQFH